MVYRERYVHVHVACDRGSCARLCGGELWFHSEKMLLASLEGNPLATHSYAHVTQGLAPHSSEYETA